MFEALNSKATLVAINYNFSSAKEFAEKLETKNILSRYGLHLQEMSFTGNGILPPPPVLNDIRSIMPYEYMSKDTSIRVAYTQNEFKLFIDKLGISTENFREFEELSKEIIDFKLSDITAIGINFSAEFNLGELKLNLLSNETIEAISDFSQNKTFEFVLPIEYPNRGLIATYRIRKVGGGDNTGEPRVYEIRVNYHFDISEMTTANKSVKIKDIISPVLYNEFLGKCKQFLSVNNGKNNK